MKKLLITALLAFTAAVSTASAQLPSVTLKTMDGKTVRTDTLSNNGKPFIIDFFATWCKLEKPGISTLIANQPKNAVVSELCYAEIVEAGFVDVDVHVLHRGRELQRHDVMSGAEAGADGIAPAPVVPFA